MQATLSRPERLALEARGCRRRTRLAASVGVLAERPGRRGTSAARSRDRPSGAAPARMPTARYSWRAMSANSRTRPSSRVAASPIGSGHCEKPAPAMLVAGLSPKPWRGSDEIVTGMPSRVASAASCIRLCHSASADGAGRPVDVEVRQAELCDEGSRRDRRESRRARRRRRRRPARAGPDGRAARPSPRASSARAGRRPGPRPGGGILVRVERPVAVQVAERGPVRRHAPAASCRAPRIRRVATSGGLVARRRGTSTGKASGRSAVGRDRDGRSALARGEDRGAPPRRRGRPAPPTPGAAAPPRSPRRCRGARARGRPRRRGT